ncbi:geranylgeranylglyceryl/heptaprenylglyceryl phosphate synthase [Flavimarina sp. Hel_I_48]|uniref:geranylgeranylglyceryl/heptaprenylglyceryl phosphate synthase n=1 Tax=Flavimarina sp. Hel_I_48 TaxID=1392488 RepID=UPI0004DF767C|nr:geranylgeranylglyceryl/heptaprenylglyceryl phosphate synthase [Flavimarina sp. Hel_I_48]
MTQSKVCLIYDQIVEAHLKGNPLFAVLIDPEKQKLTEISRFLTKIPSFSTHIFVGGSTGGTSVIKACVEEIKKHTTLPVLLFPGNHNQLVKGFDALLFLSLISGRNPDYLIGEHIKAVPFLRTSTMEVIPTGYILINGGNITSVQRVSHTLPLGMKDIDTIVATALAGQYAGKKLIYLEAGSGAKHPVLTSVIKAVHAAIDVPLIVGGGIRDKNTMEAAYHAGATLVVVGTALENDVFKV